jgi:hypothetical protein
MIADKRNLRRGHALKICFIPMQAAVAGPRRIRGAYLIWNGPSHFRLLSAGCDRYLEFRSFEFGHLALWSLRLASDRARVAGGRYLAVAHNSMRPRILLNRCRMLAGGQDRALWM